MAAKVDQNHPAIKRLKLGKKLQGVWYTLDGTHEISLAARQAGVSYPDGIEDTGPVVAIVNFRYISDEIIKSQNIGESLPLDSTIENALVSLEMASECLGQADVPAEWYLSDGDGEQAMQCLYDAIDRAIEVAGVMMQRSGAQLVVEASREIKTLNAPSVPGDPPGDDDEKRLEDLCNKLSTHQAKIVWGMWNKNHPVDWDTIAAIDGAFRDKLSSDETVLKALKRLQESLSKHYPIGQCSLDIRKGTRRAQLKHAKTEKDK